MAEKFKDEGVSETPRDLKGDVCIHSLLFSFHFLSLLFSLSLDYWPHSFLQLMSTLLQWELRRSDSLGNISRTLMTPGEKSELLFPEFIYKIPVKNSN